MSFLKMASRLDDACVCFLRYGGLVALTTVFPPAAAGDVVVEDAAPSALLPPVELPACGKQVTTYATCNAVKTGKSLNSVATGSATSAGNRTAYSARSTAG